MAYYHLSTLERKAIYYRFNSGESCRSIAKLLGRHHTTIMREIKRNKPKYYTYFDEAADQKAADRRAMPRHERKKAHPKLYDYVIEKLQHSWSPDAIAGRLKIDYPDDPSMRVSHECIYQWIYKDYQAGGDLYKHLAKTHRRRRKQHRYGSLRGLIKDRVSIQERPEIVDSRDRIGDWEGDLVEGKKGSGYIVTHVDRSSRFLLTHKIDNKQALTFNRATENLFNSICPTKIITLTLDNGKEFSAFKELEKSLGIKVYFADAYCSWQRGSNEQTNGLLRRFFPKGTDFTLLTDRQLQEAVDNINHRPTKILNYRTPAELPAETLVLLDVEFARPTKFKFLFFDNTYTIFLQGISNYAILASIIQHYTNRHISLLFVGIRFFIG